MPPKNITQGDFIYDIRLDIEDLTGYINQNFHKAEVNIGTTTKTIYLSVEPTEEQLSVLNPPAAKTDEPEKDNMVGVIIATAVITIIGSAVVGYIIFTKSQKKEENQNS